MDFPLTEYMDDDACYEKLVSILHPEGLACPRCQDRNGLKVHRRHRAPVLDYRCITCKRVFNAFTGTAFHKTHRRPAEILLILRGIAQGVPTAQLARERTGATPSAPPPAAAPAPAIGPGGRRPAAAGGHGGRGRRDVPERGGKKGTSR